MNHISSGYPTANINLQNLTLLLACVFFPSGSNSLGHARMPDSKSHSKYWGT